MARTIRREHEAVAQYLAAAVLAVVTWLALRAMPFYPPWLELALAAATGVLAAVSMSMASLLFVVAIALPVIAADFVTGIAFLLLALVVTQYLSAGKAGGFILAVIGVAAIPLHAEWAAVAVAGYLLGRGKGALTAATICLTGIAAGVALGTPLLGTIATGGLAPGFVAFNGAPENALAFGWLIPGLKAADPGGVLSAIGGIDRPALVVSQVALWTVAGALGGLTRRPRVRALSFAGPAAAVVALALGSLALDVAFNGPVPGAAILMSSAVSLPVALAATAVALWVFPEREASTAAAVVPVTGPRDVDDLLRTIASAEDELAARHNTSAVVLITDMKSFSAMTEELGSVESAKIVQRHRDLLLPIIRANGGSGAPTGGDGLVAAFSSAREAVTAAMAMQRALDGYTGSDRSPHELSVRIGIASGEVVLDTAGCPFLGAALNLSARVMDLADGGRIMVTGDVAAGSGADPAQLYTHGDFKLKNIAEAIPVVELLWRESMAPQEIRAS